MVPARAFYCVLCKEFAGDSVCAEDHLKSQTHNAKYQVIVLLDLPVRFSYKVIMENIHL